MKPAIGIYANHHGYTDVTPFEIIAVSKSENVITVRGMKYEPTGKFKPVMHVGGFSAHCSNQNEQEYTYESDPNGCVLKCHKRKSKYHGREFDYYSSRGRHIVKADPRRFYDYNF